MTIQGETKQSEYMAQLKAFVEECLKPCPLLDKEGNLTGLYQMQDAAGAVKALEQLGKLTGMF